MFSRNSHTRSISTRDSFFANISPIPLAPLTPIPLPIIHVFNIDDKNERQRKCIFHIRTTSSQNFWEDVVLSQKIKECEMQQRMKTECRGNTPSRLNSFSDGVAGVPGSNPFLTCLKWMGDHVNKFGTQWVELNKHMQCQCRNFHEWCWIRCNEWEMKTM